MDQHIDDITNLSCRHSVKLLEAEGIAAVKLVQNDSSYVLIGETEIFVKEEFADKAIQIIKTLDN